MLLTCHPETLATLKTLNCSNRTSSSAHSSVVQFPIKVALIGVGRWGNHLLRNLLDNPNAQVVAIVDSSQQRLDTIATDLANQEIILMTDWLKVMSLPELEAVVIATPATTHYHLIRTALQHNLHVLAEKPLTLDIADSLELCRLAEQQQCQLVIDHTYLFHPVVQRGKQILQRGTIGNPRYGYATRTHLGPVRNDVDALWDLAIHDIAIFNHWLDELPIKVQAQGKIWLQTRSPDTKYFPSGLSDLIWIQLYYPSGFQASIHLCWANPDKQRRLCLVGDQGTLVFDELNADSPLTLLQGKLEQNQNHFSPTKHKRHVFSVDTVEPLSEVCQHFLTCVQTNTLSPTSSGWLGAELVQILSALTQSLNQDGQPINLQIQ